MATRHKSAVKRHRQSEIRAARNQAIRSRVRNEVRELRDTVSKREVANAETQLRSVIKTLGKAVTKGVLHRNNASRHVARLSRQVHALKKAAS
ncbi:MAG TPA: 30S ribosomal protein S20 [Candidatus Acidoferrales bacterium]|nr:30S ribosomal protein S20 [Candidatus Acidoferrales bacterium]